ncbi:MAG: TonB-dependent receptor [Candidatus Binatia bacterium]
MAAVKLAGAQEVPTLSAPGIEEIVVTAQKRTQFLGDVPIAISAFSGEDLTKLGVVDTRDLGRIIPGFSYAESGYSVPIYTLRGVGFNEASQTASATVGLYVDEQNLPFPVMSKGAMLDLERVEVLKGPQGTLYGRNTTGGAINYIARKPTDEFEAGITASLGRFLTTDVEGFVSGPIVTDVLRGRLALRNIRSEQGWQYSLTRPDDRLGEIDKQSGRLTLDWQTLDSLKTTFTLTGWRDVGEPQAPQVIGFEPQNNITAGPLRALGFDPTLVLAPAVRNHPTVPTHTDDNQVADWSDLDWQNDERFGMAAMRSDWDVTETNTVTLLASYDNFRNDHSLIPQSGLSVSNTERDLLVKTNAYAIELRMDGSIGSDIDGLVGGFVSRDHVFEYQSVHVNTDSVTVFLPVDGLTTITDRVDTKGEQVSDTKAIFANGNWRFLPTLSLNLGARYTTEKREYSGCVVDSPFQTRGIGFSAVFNAISLVQGGTGGAMEGDCVTLDAETSNPGLFEGTLDEDNVSGRAALDWTPLEDQLFYASFSRGFKSGSFPVLAASTSAQYTPAIQEQVHAFEIGAKSAFLDRGLRLNAAAFYYDYTDKQLLGRIQDPIFGSLPILVNVPESRVLGVELEAESQPLDGLFLRASGIFLDTEVTRGETLDGQGNRVNLEGKPFNFAPEWVFTFDADHTRPLSETLEAGAGGSFTYKTETNSTLTEDPRFVVDDYFLADFRLSLASADGKWQVTGWVRNVTDEFYSNGTFNTGDTISRYAGMPRMFGGTLTLRF